MPDKIPQLDGNPVPCPVCDATLTLGLLTSTCESLDPEHRGKCFDIIKPLETGSKKAAEVLRDVLVELGENDFNKTVDRMNVIVMSATASAKDELIRRGVLDKNGMPKESAVGVP